MVKSLSVPRIFLGVLNLFQESSYSSVECHENVHSASEKNATDLKQDTRKHINHEMRDKFGNHAGHWDETKFDNHCPCGTLDHLPTRSVLRTFISVDIERQASPVTHIDFSSYPRNPPAFFFLSTSPRACFSQRLPADCRFSIPRRVSVRLIGFNYGIR